MEDNKCPFDSWMLLLAYNIVKWVHRQSYEQKIFSSDGLTKDIILDNLEEYIFNSANDIMGAKPIGKCTIEELVNELKKRKVDCVITRDSKNL